MSTTYVLSKLVAANTTDYYRELNNYLRYLQTKDMDAYSVVYNAATNEISILGSKGTPLTVYTNSANKKYVFVKNYYVFLDDILNLIPKSDLSSTFNELLVYSAKHKVSQYFTNVSIGSVMSTFKRRLKNDTIEITDFTFVDMINNKTLTIKPVVKVINYIVE